MEADKAVFLARREAARAHALTMVVLFFCIATCMLLVVMGRQWLPSRFLGDGYLIERIAQRRVSLVHNSSFVRVADVYRVLHLQNSPMLASVMGYGLTVLTVLYAVRGRAAGIRGWPTTVVAVSCLGLGGVFLGWYSKDFLVLGLTAVLIHQLGRTDPHARWWLTLVPMLAYAAWFRDYWAGIAGLFAGLYVVSRLRPATTFRALILRLFLLSQAFLAAMALLFPVLAGKPADFSRTAANVDRLADPNAASAIGRFVDTVEPLSTYVNLALTQIGLVVPWPLLAAREPQHLVYAVFLGFLWLGAGWTMAKRFTLLAERERDVVRLGVSFWVALLTVQALFEPDYGSYLRHLTPILPLILCVLVSVQASQPRPSTSATTVKKHRESPLTGARER